LTQTRPLASADALLTAVRARQNELGLSNEAVEDLAGFCAGTVNKYLGPAREKSPTIRTLFLMLEAMGVGLVLAEDAEAVQRMRTRWAQRIGKHAVTDKRKRAA
jgi:transcriptional regulator with XRE-family HTH domain